jgi:hypothetical protein
MLIMEIFFPSRPKKKYCEAFPETLSPISFGSLADWGANQNPVHPGIYGIVPELLRSLRN